ncbi:MAG TPA: ABC transporter permease subunit, partial [Rhizobacter sp.]
MLGNLDFSWLTAATLQSYILKGLLFSVQLTLIAMVGGIVLGTLLALMRLSGRKWLEVPAAAYVNTMRS